MVGCPREERHCRNRGSGFECSAGGVGGMVANGSRDKTMNAVGVTLTWACGSSTPKCHGFPTNSCRGLSLCRVTPLSPTGASRLPNKPHTHLGFKNTSMGTLFEPEDELECVGGVGGRAGEALVGVRIVGGVGGRASTGRGPHLLLLMRLRLLDVAERRMTLRVAQLVRYLCPGGFGFKSQCQQSNHVRAINLSYSWGTN